MSSKLFLLKALTKQSIIDIDYILTHPDVPADTIKHFKKAYSDLVVAAGIITKIEDMQESQK